MANKGTFDVGFEASGSAEALIAAIDAVKPGSTIVQVGLSGGALPTTINMIVSKEVSLRGSFRSMKSSTEAVVMRDRRDRRGSVAYPHRSFEGRDLRLRAGLDALGHEVLASD